MLVDRACQSGAVVEAARARDDVAIAREQVSDVALRRRLPVRPRDPDDERLNPGEHRRCSPDVAVARAGPRPAGGRRAPRRRAEGRRSRRTAAASTACGRPAERRRPAATAEALEARGDEADERHPARPREASTCDRGDEGRTGRSPTIDGGRERRRGPSPPRSPRRRRPRRARATLPACSSTNASANRATAPGKVVLALGDPEPPQVGADDRADDRAERDGVERGHEVGAPSGGPARVTASAVRSRHVARREP